MKTNTIVIFLCLALAANASWVESLTKSSWFSHLMNHTQLRGKVNINTDNGIKLDYDAKLGYQNGKLAVDIADVGAKINVERQNSTNLSNDDYQRAYNYSGAVAVNHNGHKANVTVDGIAQVAGTYNQSNEDNVTHVNYTIHTKNTNKWVANGANAQVEGGHISQLNVSGQAEKNGSHIKAKHGIHGFGLLGGNVTHDGEHIGSGFVAKGGEADVDTHVYLTGGNVAEINYQGHHAKPDAISEGKAAYKGFTSFGWNNETRGYVKDGHAEFDGIAWTKSHSDDNGTFNGFAVAKNIDFSHKGQIFTNGKKVADTLSVGDVAILKSGGVHVNTDGSWEKGFGSTGVLNKWTVGKLAGHHDETNSSDSMTESSNDSEELRIKCILYKYSSNKTIQEECEKLKNIDDHHHKGTFLSKFKANWAHQAKINGSQTDENSTNIDFHTGALYKVAGYDTLSQKPWEHHGYKTVSGSYNIAADSNQPANLSIHF